MESILPVPRPSSLGKCRVSLQSQAQNTQKLCVKGCAHQAETKKSLVYVL